ncbi:MAG: pagL [Gammaproteobacteria bacterium]|jgi:hypothetical protein|nr:pagL [Gammaproteobacteria bacterium]
MNMKKIALLISGLALSSSVLAAPAYTQGIAISYGKDYLTNSQPHNASGYKIDYDYQQSNWSWYNNSLNVYVQANYAHWQTNSYNNYGTVGVVGLAPVARWYFASMPSVAPYLEASVGLAKLSNDHFGDRNLGSSVLFQDIGGIGAAFGQNKQVFASVSAIHYSNAGLKSENDGVTIPVMMTIGYQFS